MQDSFDFLPMKIVGFYRHSTCWEIQISGGLTAVFVSDMERRLALLECDGTPSVEYLMRVLDEERWKRLKSALELLMQ